MAGVDAVRLNGTIYSWLSCEFTIDGQEYEGFVAVDYDQKLERRVVPSVKRDGKPLGKTTGKYGVSLLTIKVLRVTAQLIKEYLAGRADGVSYGAASFSFMVQVHEPDVLPGPITVLFDTCTIEGEKEVHEEGIEALLTEFTLGCLSLSQDKMSLWSVLGGSSQGAGVLDPDRSALPDGQDSIRIGGVLCPGKATITSCNSPRKWDVRKIPYFSGATLVSMGAEPCRFTVRVELWTGAQFTAWKAFAAKFLKVTMRTPNAIATDSAAVGISHPVLSIPPMNICAAVVENVSALQQDDSGLWSCEIAFIEYVKPVEVKATTPTAIIPATAAPRPTAQDAGEAAVAAVAAEFAKQVAGG